MIEKSPLVRFSEGFFKHYGETGHVYFGTQGLRNFLKDVFKGKHRYQGFKVQRFVWSLDKDSALYHELTDYFGV